MIGMGAGDWDAAFQSLSVREALTYPTTSKDISRLDNIKKNLGKFADAVHRYGITLTGMLPFSSRGVILNFVLAPFFIPLRIIQSIGPEFSEKMRRHLDKDWNQGIKDFYIDLESKKNADLRLDVVGENLRYAAYMYKGIPKNTESGLAGNTEKSGSEKGVLIQNGVFPQSIPREDVFTLQDILIKLTEMGFNSDLNGNFYHTDTGNMFNLIYDTERNEIVICFMGLGNHRSFDISDGKTKQKLRVESYKAAGADWFGGIPPSARQAIEIGKMLKDLTEGTQIKPVMVGHSHGGGLAQAGAVANGIKAIVFNSRPMGAGTRRYIGQSKIATNSQNIVTFSGRGDWLSGIVIVNYLAVIFERLTGIPVPRSVGTGYHLPNLPGESKRKYHVKFYEAMVKLHEMPLS